MQTGTKLTIAGLVLALLTSAAGWLYTVAHLSGSVSTLNDNTSEALRLAGKVEVLEGTMSNSHSYLEALKRNKDRSDQLLSEIQNVVKDAETLFEDQGDVSTIRDALIGAGVLDGRFVKWNGQCFLPHRFRRCFDPNPQRYAHFFTAQAECPPGWREEENFDLLAPGACPS